MIRLVAGYAECKWCLRHYLADENGRPEEHKRLSVHPAGGSRFVPCVAPSELDRRGLGPLRVLR